ncbi:GreA/GreB family elongation factor, partial [Chloroflexota bacterium]
SEGDLIVFVGGIIEMSNGSKELSLGEAVSRFLAGLPPEERGARQQEIYKFIRWFGLERTFAKLTAAEVANYAEQLSISDTDYARKLELIRAFLAAAKKKEWSKTNLAVHLKAKKGKTRLQSPSKRHSPEAILLTQQGYTDLEAELVVLQGKRLEAIDEIRRAAADKDFRENVPLQAAREARGQLEGRIMELEETMRLAVVIDEKQKAPPGVNIGDSVTICDVDSGEELHYMLVSPREVDPTRCKISSDSPIGRAIIGKGQGEMVEVVVPAGKLHYQIKQVE